MYLLKQVAMSVLVVALAAHAQSVRPKIRVTEEDVAQSMLQSGYAVDPLQVSLLSTIPATIEHPDLKVLKLEPMAGDKSRALLRCADRSACIPFYAMVSGTFPKNGTHAVVSANAKSRAVASDVLMKQGSTAILEIASREMLITLPVICLQSGRVGERIRVTSSDRKMTYVAEVVQKGLLRSSL